MTEDYIFNREKKQADAYTKERNKKYMEEQGILPMDEKNPEYAQLHENCILSVESFEDYALKDHEGNVALDMRPYHFIHESEAPDSVNPSLWMMAQCNLQSGVFAYCGNHILQARGVNDNLTLVRGKSGWIMIDVPSSDEKIIAGVELCERAIGENIRDSIVAAVIGTGINDIYGHYRAGLEGLRAVTGGRKIPVYASAKLGRTMTEENIYSSVVNMRKVPFQFGSEKPGPQGYVTAGFTVGIPGGSSAFLPDEILPENGTFTIDGIEIESTYIGDIGTPADLALYFPQYRALWVSELTIGTLHNIYTVRGAKPRDAKAWARHIYDMYIRYGDRTDVLLQATNWTHRNTKEQPMAVKDYLLTTAGMYRYIHDQTLHLAHRGYRPEEIIENFEYPKGLAKQLCARPYYGSLEMSIRGIYDSWFGSADGNPVNLRRQTKAEAAAQFIEYVGSEERVFEKAFEDYKNRRYQRAIEALDKIMFYNPENEKARCLYADILEQLGYQSECGTMRNAYLHGAKELREGAVRTVPQKDQVPAGDFVQFASSMRDADMLEYLSVSVNGARAQDENMRIDLRITHDDGEKRYLLTLIYGALLYAEADAEAVFPDAVHVKTVPGILTKLISGEIAEIESWIETDDAEALWRFASVLDNPLDNLGYSILEMDRS